MEDTTTSGPCCGPSSAPAVPSRRWCVCWWRACAGVARSREASSSPGTACWAIARATTTSPTWTWSPPPSSSSTRSSCYTSTLLDTNNSSSSSCLHWCPSGSCSPGVPRWMLLLVLLVLLLAVSLLAVAGVHVLSVVGASSSRRIVDAGRSCVVGAAPHEEEEEGCYSRSEAGKAERTCSFCVKRTAAADDHQHTLGGRLRGDLEMVAVDARTRCGLNVGTDPPRLYLCNHHYPRLAVARHFERRIAGSRPLAPSIWAPGRARRAASSCTPRCLAHTDPPPLPLLPLPPLCSIPPLAFRLCGVNNKKRKRKRNQSFLINATQTGRQVRRH